jgi:hypothetical protein
VILRVSLLLFATVLSLSCLVATTRADGPRALMLIQRGESEGGMRWSQRARANGDHVITQFTSRGADDEPEITFDDAHLSRRDPVAMAPFSDVAPAGEQVLEGSAYSTVVRLRLEFADGMSRDITPVRAPKGAVAKWRSLGHFRFFLVVVPQQPVMKRLVAVDRRGKTVSSIPLG